MAAILALGLTLPAYQAGAADLDSFDHPSYPIPDGAIFVAPGGGADATGTADDPFPTIKLAMTKAAPGDTVVIRAGTYREPLGSLSKPLTLQPFGQDTVWIKGSVVVDDWRREGSGWVHGPWDPGHCHDCVAQGVLDPRFPNAGLPDQAFLDGRPLQQVTEMAQLAPGTFLVDRVSKSLILGSDPTGHLIEASVHSEALVVLKGAEGTRVRGLGFAHFSPLAQDGVSGMVKGDAARLTFEHNYFSHSAAVGLNIYAEDAVVRGNIFYRNGLAGFGAWRADRLLLERNVFDGNNDARFLMNGDLAAAAGAKITQSGNVVVTENRVTGTHGNGLWFDINVAGAEIVANRVAESGAHGIYFEISTGGRIASNTVLDSLGAGILISGATHVRVLDNILSGNAIGWSVIDDARRNSDAAEIALGNTWITASVAVEGNRIWRTGIEELAIFVRDFSETVLPEAMLSRVDGNLYGAAPEVSAPFAEWWRGNQVQMLETLDAYRMSTGFDQDAGVLISAP